MVGSWEGTTTALCCILECLLKVTFSKDVLVLEACTHFCS